MLTVEMQTAGEQTAILKIQGAATVEAAQELQQALLDGLRSCEELRLDCSAVSEIDFFAVQLICSAHRTSVVWNKSLVFHGEPSAAVKTGIRASGFYRHTGCSLCPDGVRCMWL